MMRQISANIQNATFFTIMADETDVFSKELVICIRWVDDCFVTHKDFIRMHPLERKNADQVVAIPKNAPQSKFKNPACPMGLVANRVKTHGNENKNPRC